MAAKKLSFAIIGTSVDGLTVAATPCRAGFNVQVYEQAARFERRRRGHRLAEGYNAGNVPLATMEPVSKLSNGDKNASRCFSDF